MGSALGKRIGNSIYLHICALHDLDGKCQTEVLSAAAAGGIEIEKDFNVVRLDKEGTYVSLLLYQDFFESPFPSLLMSHTVDLRTGTVKQRRYDGSENPPILHRKELLLPQDHPDRRKFEALTREAEAAGLFTDSHRIGFRRYWEELIRSTGYRLEGHCLVKTVHVSEPAWTKESEIERYRTAISRYTLSSPMQRVAHFGYLDGNRTVFDYGCGRGDDLRWLVQNGITSWGWDPYFAPDNPKVSADIVNLGFVVNVIEDPAERVEALSNAFALARQLLVVSAMLAGRAASGCREYGDGVLTRRSTFQKYFTQTELREFIENVLSERAIAVGPGIFFVFRDKLAEQRFLGERQRNRNRLRHLVSRIPKPTRAEQDAAFYEKHHAILDPLWECWVTLGREPDLSEVPHRQEILEVFGSLKKAFGFLVNLNGIEVLDAARQSRRDDLLVYFALQQFQRRKPYRTLPDNFQRDIKAFFSSYSNAQQEAARLLYSLANTETVLAACTAAADVGLGYLEETHSLQLHSSLVEQLPPVLRAYIGCGIQLYGDVSNADLIKIHIDSGKLTLMVFDDFTEKPLPRLMERIKIRMRDQAIDFFGYGEGFSSPYLYLKSRFIDRDFPHYDEQVKFDQALQALGFLDFSGYGPAPEEFERGLRQARWTVNGFQLERSQIIPHLDEPCGKYLTYRQFIECGETQTMTGIANLPKQPETYTALATLATQLLDPVMDYFGGIQLTYGFCSQALTKHISGHIAPERDQHAAHELNARGRPICPRLGAAVDFFIPDESMLEVAQWIVANTPFDRLYFYGDRKPIHVSVGPEQKGEIVIMHSGAKGRLIPKVIKADIFLSLVRDPIE